MEIERSKEIGFTREIYTVSRLNFEIKQKLEVDFSGIYIEGEVSNFYCHNNKHYYFDLKDQYSKIKVVMFNDANRKLGFTIEDGLHLILSGYVSVYEKRGEYQLIAMTAEPAGKGALLLAFEQLKRKLEEKGYFDIARKKPLPAIPHKIGAVTSTGGAVIRDIISVLTARFGNFHLIVRNVNVQGASSKEEVCSAIRDLCEYGVDVIIVARGGGSLEDLWAFNTEQVAVEIFSCPVPVISAVGHETDFTICDFVADVRAATPSVAANLVITDKKEIIREVEALVGKAAGYILKRIYILKKELGFLKSSRIFLNPQILIASRQQDHDLTDRRLKETIKVIMQDKKHGFDRTAAIFSRNRVGEGLAVRKILLANYLMELKFHFRSKTENLKSRILGYIKDLQLNSPVSVLEKGFSLVMNQDETVVIKSIKQSGPGDEIKVFLKDGVLHSKVLEIIQKKLETRNADYGGKN
jgi:exodeoxyribonuclease VII large subunit